MIGSVTIKHATEKFEWVNEVPLFKEQKVFEFKPGINIIFGPNGSGKSTLLGLIALHLAAKQGGTSCVTESFVREVTSLRLSEILLPCSVAHDGQPVMYFDARAKEGLDCGHLDDDFFSLGMSNSLFKGSTGEHVYARLDRLLRNLGKPPSAPNPSRKVSRSRTSKSLSRDNRSPVATFPSHIERKICKENVNDLWGAALEKVDTLLRPTIEKGPRTLLLDEPDSGYSALWQAGLYSNVIGKAEDSEWQIIIATHSPFALALPNINVIETVPGYVNQIKELYRKLGAHV